MPFFETLFGGIIENARRLVENFYNPNVRISQSNAKRGGLKGPAGPTGKPKKELKELRVVHERLNIVKQKMKESQKRRLDSLNSRKVPPEDVDIYSSRHNREEIYFDPQCRGRKVQIWTVNKRTPIYNSRLNDMIRSVELNLEAKNVKQSDVPRLLRTLDEWSDVPSEAEDISMPPHKMLDVPQKMNYRLFFGYFMQTHGRSIATRVRNSVSRGQNAKIQHVKFEETEAADGIGWYFNIYDKKKQVSTFSIHLPNGRRDNRLHFYMKASENRYHVYKRIKFRKQHDLVGAVVYSENKDRPIPGPIERGAHTHAFNEILTECLLRINATPETRKDIFSKPYRPDWIISALRNTFACYLSEKKISTMNDALDELDLSCLSDNKKQIKYLCTGKLDEGESFIKLDKRVVARFLIENAGKTIHKDIFNRLKSSVARMFNCSEKVAVYYMEKQLLPVIDQMRHRAGSQTCITDLSEEEPRRRPTRKEKQQARRRRQLR